MNPVAESIGRDILVHCSFLECRWCLNVGPSCDIASSLIGPSMLAQGVLRACLRMLRPARPRLRLKRPLLRSEAVTGTGGKKNSYIRLWGIIHLQTHLNLDIIILLCPMFRSLLMGKIPPHHNIGFNPPNLVLPN